jgi:hypothetical protein
MDDKVKRYIVMLKAAYSFPEAGTSPAVKR